MKFDVLELLKTQLQSSYRSPNTSRKYYAAIVKFFDNIQFNSVEDIPAQYIKEQLQTIKGKNEFSAIKNGLKNMKIVYPNFMLPEEEFFKTLSLQKKNRSKKPKKCIYLDSTMRKINQIKNIKLKYAHRLAIISGLRVSELASLAKKDLIFNNGIIEVNVRNGKGGSNGTVPCMEDNYLYENLQKFAEESTSEELFYSESYMRKIASELGFECHDLRRIFAINFRNDLKKELPILEANAKTQEALRHIRFSTTKRYLFNRKLVIKPTQRENSDGK